MQTDISDKFLTISEVAEILSVSSSLLYKQVSQGTLPVVRLGRAIRVEQTDLISFIERNHQSTIPSWQKMNK
jgi:excisionase family DNA binding protein